MRRIVVCILLVAAACSESRPATPSPQIDSDDAGLPAGLCSAVEAASQGDVAGAARAFRDEVHGPLHDLAGDVADMDRAAAADVLVAKNVVETDIESDVRASRLARDLRTLLESVKRGYDTLDEAVGACG